MNKLQMFFDEEAEKTLNRLQAAGGHNSKGETIQAAIGFYEWARVHIANGRRIGVLAVDHSAVSEVVLPFQEDYQKENEK